MTTTLPKEAFAIDALIYAIKEAGPEVWQSPIDFIGRDDDADSSLLVQIHIPPSVQRAMEHMAKRLQSQYPNTTFGDMETWFYTFITHFGIHTVVSSLVGTKFDETMQQKLKETADGQARRSDGADSNP